jgi:hypothetical protein
MRRRIDTFIKQCSYTAFTGLAVEMFTWNRFDNLYVNDNSAGVYDNKNTCGHTNASVAAGYVLGDNERVFDMVQAYQIAGNEELTPIKRHEMLTEMFNQFLTDKE